MKKLFTYEYVSMPRPPRLESPLRLIRNALDFTQSDFAHELGVSESYIQAIEIGQRAISDNLAFEISFRYGFTVESLKQVMGAPVPVLTSDPLAGRHRYETGIR